MAMTTTTAGCNAQAIGNSLHKAQGVQKDGLEYGAWAHSLEVASAQAITFSFKSSQFAVYERLSDNPLLSKIWFIMKKRRSLLP